MLLSAHGSPAWLPLALLPALPLALPLALLRALLLALPSLFFKKAHILLCFVDTVFLIVYFLSLPILSIVDYQAEKSGRRVLV
jgi:hypothetical protein